jgi:hypothetical protein
MGLKPCFGKSSVALFINLMEEDKCQWKGMSINKNEKMISIDLGIFFAVLSLVKHTNYSSLN